MLASNKTTFYWSRRDTFKITWRISLTRRPCARKLLDTGDVMLPHRWLIRKSKHCLYISSTYSCAFAVSDLTRFRLLSEHVSHPPLFGLHFLILVWNSIFYFPLALSLSLSLSLFRISLHAFPCAPMHTVVRLTRTFLTCGNVTLNRCQQKNYLLS